MLVVAELGVDAQDRLGDGEQVAGRHELVEQVARRAEHRRPAADRRAEAALAVAHDRAQPEVVDRRHGVVLGAALECDLELSRQRRAERVAQQVARERLGVRRHVERLVGRDAGVGARGDVSHGVAARLARRQPRVAHDAHRMLDVVELHEVELHVLPRRQVAEAARVLIGDVGERPQLQTVEDPLRDLGAQHLGVLLLPLAVGPADEAEGAPLGRADLAALEAVERRDELVDIGLVRERESRASERPGIVDG